MLSLRRYLLRWVPNCSKSEIRGRYQLVSTLLYGYWVVRGGHTLFEAACSGPRRNSRQLGPTGAVFHYTMNGMEWNGMEWNGMVEARSYVRALRAATADILCHCCQCQPPQQQQQCIQRHRTQPGTSQRRTGSTVHWLSIYPISPHGVDVSQPIARTEAAADKAKT